MLLAIADPTRGSQLATKDFLLKKVEKIKILIKRKNLL
jgi:hypothetical protein